MADAAVIAGALALAATFALLDGAEETLYRGGFAVVGVATVLLIAGSVHPDGRIGRRVLELAPLRWVGTRSYGIYLWHWPIYTITRPDIDLPVDGVALLALRLVATGLVAEFSYRFVEQPIRRGALGRAWQRWREEAWRTAPGTRSVVRTRLAATALAAVASVSGLLVTVAAASPPGRPSYLPSDDVTGVIVGSSPSPAAWTPQPSLPATPSPSPSGLVAPPTAHAIPPVLAVGDSMLVATAPFLADALGKVEVDAHVGRQVDEGIDILEARQKAGTLPPIVVLNLGVNGPLYKAQFERAMAALTDVDMVLWVTVNVPRPWEKQTNSVLEQNVPRYANARLVDWHAASEGHKELFWKDGYHPRPEGATLYAKLIVQAVLGATASR